MVGFELGWGFSLHGVESLDFNDLLAFEIGGFGLSNYGVVY